jgi:uncharacterized protein YjbI with pentapeptide repeats
VTSEEPLDLCDRTFRNERLGPADLAPNSEVVDVTLEDCDVIGVLAQKSRLERVTITGSRLRGVSWAVGVIRGVTLDAVTGQDLSCRFSTLRVVTLRDCQLPEADFTEAEFDQVLFERCDLRRARFDHVKVKSLRVAGCNLAGASGAIDLRGASMDLDDVLSLAPSLARETGITIE